MPKFKLFTYCKPVEISAQEQDYLMSLLINSEGAADTYCFATQDGISWLFNRAYYDNIAARLLGKIYEAEGCKHMAKYWFEYANHFLSQGSELARAKGILPAYTDKAESVTEKSRLLSKPNPSYCNSQFSINHLKLF